MYLEFNHFPIVKLHGTKFQTKRGRKYRLEIKLSSHSCLTYPVSASQRQPLLYEVLMNFCRDIPGMGYVFFFRFYTIAYNMNINIQKKYLVIYSDFEGFFKIPNRGIGEGNGNPLQCSCLENPRVGGAWWASVYGVAQSWT